MPDFGITPGYQGPTGWSPGGGLAPAPLSSSPSSAGSFLGWFTDTVQQFATQYGGGTGSPSFGPMTTAAPLPHWVREQLPTTGVPPQMRSQLAEGAYNFESVDDARVFMGRFDLTDDESVKQAGTNVSARTIRGLTGTDDPATRSKQGKVREPSTITVAEAKELPWGWGKDRQRKWMKRLEENTGLQFAGIDEAVEVWGLAVERAAKMFNASKGNNLVTPWDALDLYKDEGLFAGEGGAGEESVPFSGVKKQRHVDVNKISEGDAWATMRSAVSSLLGRDPADQEVRDFAYRMNNLAAKNPSISETVTRYNEGEAVRSKTSVIEPGMTANDVALAAYEDAQDDPDYGAYQAASTYMNLLLQSLGPTV